MKRGASVARGRDAIHAGDIPMSGWKDVLFRLHRRFGTNRQPITAAGVAFYALLATFPGLLALLGIYALIFDQQQLIAQLDFLQRELKPEATDLVIVLIRGLAESDRAEGFGIAGGAVVTLWGASLGVRALMGAMNLAYDEAEKRSVVQRNGVALALTGGAIFVAFCMGVTLMSLPIVEHWLQPTAWVQRLVFYARWPIVALMFWLSLLVFYRYGPSRAPARWSWVSWGALLATGMWLAGTGVLAWYVAGWRSYQQAYGSIGIVVLVLAWFLLSAFSVLMGAEINAELERQTGEDTTVGLQKPAGARGAVAADTLGESVS